jgi:hypothetical protein
MKPAKRIRIVLLSVLFVATAGLATLAAVNLVRGLPLFRLPELSLVRTERRTQSDILLEQIREIYRFQTVEHVRKVVFPYDFLSDNLSVAEIVSKARANPGPLEDSLTAEELTHLEAHNLAESVGLDVDPQGGDFMVVEAVIRGGFDLESSPFDPRFQGENGESPPVQIREVESQNGGVDQVVYVRTPSSVVLEIVIEDASSEAYRYPDVPLRPDEWRRVAEFVSSKLRSDERAGEVQKEAIRNGQAFIRTILEQAGFQRVAFF